MFFKKKGEREFKKEDPYDIFQKNVGKVLIGIYDSNKDEVLLQPAIEEKVWVVVDDKTGEFLSAKLIKSASEFKELDQNALLKLNVEEDKIPKIPRFYSEKGGKRQSGHIYMLKKMGKMADKNNCWGFSVIPGETIETTKFVWVSHSLNFKEGRNQNVFMPLMYQGPIQSKIQSWFEPEKRDSLEQILFDIRSASSMEKLTDLLQTSINPADAMLATLLEDDLATLHRLLDAKVDINAMTESKKTSLFVAAENDDVAGVHLFLNYKADVNKREEEYNATPLLIAAEHGYFDVVERLLKVPDIDINARTNDGTTPLFMAAEYGHFDIVKLLLEAKADLNNKLEDGTTVLFVAAEYGHDDVTELLIKANANVEARLNNGITPLFAAAEKNHIETLQVLLEHKADVNGKTNDGETSLFIAAEKGHIGIVKLLLQYNANCHVEFEGATPYDIAIKKGHSEIAELLHAHMKEQEPVEPRIRKPGGP